MVAPETLRRELDRIRALTNSTITFLIFWKSCHTSMHRLEDFDPLLIIIT